MATVAVMASAIIIMLLINQSQSFSVISTPLKITSSQQLGKTGDRLGPLYSSRRSFMHTSAVTAFGTFTVFGSNRHAANALPMVTVFEFEQILKDSGECESAN